MGEGTAVAAYKAAAEGETKQSVPANAASNAAHKHEETSAEDTKQSQEALHDAKVEDAKAKALTEKAERLEADQAKEIKHGAKAYASYDAALAKAGVGAV